MSKNTRIRFLVVLPVLAFLAFVVTVTDLGALAQNTNSSTPTQNTNSTTPTQNENTTPTQNESAQNENAEAAPEQPAGRRRRRRGQRPVPDANVATEAEAAAPAQNTNTGAMPPGEQTDLSGTWTGRVRMSGGHEMDGQGTLTITGNTFTLTSEGMSHNGRVIAITTRGYTGAAFLFDDLTDPVSNTKLVCSVRVRRGRNNLTLTPVPGARNRLNFNGRAGT